MHDLMVIGDDISSYIAAAVGVKYGLNTIHIAEHNLKDMSINDIFFNADALPLTGFGDGQTAVSLLQELGIHLDDNLSQSDPAYQVILPEHRLDFFADKESLRNDLVREFPQKEKQIKSFYKLAEKNSRFLKKWLSDHPFFQFSNFKQYFNYIKLYFNLIRFDWKNNKFKRMLSKNPSLQKVFEAQLALLSSDIDAFESLSSSYHFYAPTRGIHRFTRGKIDLNEALLDSFKSAGGEYTGNQKLLSIRKTKLIDAEVMDDQGIISQISARNLIISNKSDGLKVLYKKKKQIKTYKWLKRTKLTHYPLTLHFVVSGKCLPEKMSFHTALISDIRRDIYDDNLIILEVNAPDREKRNTQGKKLITATVFLPSGSNCWAHENIIAAADSVMNRLEYFLPFLKDNIKFYDVKKSIDMSINYRNIVNGKYKVKKSLLTGFSAQKNKTSLKNVYLTGASLFTDIGWEAEIISGMFAVYSVLKARKKA